MYVLSELFDGRFLLMDFFSQCGDLFMMLLPLHLHLHVNRLLQFTLADLRLHGGRVLVGRLMGRNLLCTSKHHPIDIPYQ